ncbi:Putative signaling protein (fragment) [Desulfamplus magnetovallimortis]|uniref:Putative signaling protein n=1 Tax=Desulfamplus magnetovallimortis TaxID=1246637 RepID=A0A1W1HHI8_9BACT
MNFFTGFISGMILFVTVLAVGVNATGIKLANEEDAIKLSNAEPIKLSIQESIKLSSEEQLWLEEHKTIKVGVGVAFPPYMWVDEKDGKPVFRGMVSDYIDLISRKLNVEMQVVYDIPFNKALELGKSGEIDFFPCLSQTPERSEFLLFTNPYLIYPMVIITRDDAPIIGGVEDLAGKRLAVVKHLIVYSRIQNDYPDLDVNYVFTGRVDENLENVSLGQADACIVNLAVASYFIHQKGLTNLKIAAPINWEGSQLAMAVRNDWPVFHGIITKTVDSFSQDEKDRISLKWIKTKYEPGVDIALVWRWSLGTVFFVAIVFFYFSDGIADCKKRFLKGEKQSNPFVRVMKS